MAVGIKTLINIYFQRNGPLVDSLTESQYLSIYMGQFPQDTVIGPCIVQGYIVVWCSVVQWCQRDLEFCPSNPSKKISHNQLKKQGLLY